VFSSTIWRWIHAFNFISQSILYIYKDHICNRIFNLLQPAIAEFKETLEKILAQKARDRQALGRPIKNFNAEQWNRSPCQLVVEGNCHKFDQQEESKQFLLQQAINDCGSKSSDAAGICINGYKR